MAKIIIQEMLENLEKSTAEFEIKMHCLQMITHIKDIHDISIPVTDENIKQHKLLITMLECLGLFVRELPKKRDDL